MTTPNNILRVKRQILTCKKCELVKECQSPIPLTHPSKGDHVSVSGITNGKSGELSTPISAAQFTVIGEAPGRIEDHNGKPFVGPAGQLLRRSLSQVGLDEGDGWWMNVVSCWPHGTPTSDQMQACRGNLKSQLEVSRGPVLVCGKTALRSLIPHANTHTSGKFIPVHDKLIFPVTHPSFFLWKPREKELMDKWISMLAVFASTVLWGEAEWQENEWCIYCNGYGFPACRVHKQLWYADSKWERKKRRSKKKGLQDEALFERGEYT